MTAALLAMLASSCGRWEKKKDTSTEPDVTDEPRSCSKDSECIDDVECTLDVCQGATCYNIPLHTLCDGDELCHELVG